MPFFFSLVRSERRASCEYIDSYFHLSLGFEYGLSWFLLMHHATLLYIFKRNAQGISREPLLSSFSIGLRNMKYPTSTEQRRFRQIYGISTFVCKFLCIHLFPRLSKNCIQNTSYTLFGFQKLMSQKKFSAVAENCTEKTFCDNAWELVEQMSSLDLVSRLYCTILFESQHGKRIR